MTSDNTDTTNTDSSDTDPIPEPVIDFTDLSIIDSQPPKDTGYEHETYENIDTPLELITPESHNTTPTDDNTEETPTADTTANADTDTNSVPEPEIDFRNVSIDSDTESNKDPDVEETEDSLTDIEPTSEEPEPSTDTSEQTTPDNLPSPTETDDALTRINSFSEGSNSSLPWEDADSDTNNSPSEQETSKTESSDPTVVEVIDQDENTITQNTPSPQVKSKQEQDDSDYVSSDSSPWEDLNSSTQQENTTEATQTEPDRKTTPEQTTQSNLDQTQQAENTDSPVRATGPNVFSNTYRETRIDQPRTTEEVLESLWMRIANGIIGKIVPTMKSTSIRTAEITSTIIKGVGMFFILSYLIGMTSAFLLPHTFRAGATGIGGRMSVMYELTATVVPAIILVYCLALCIDWIIEEETETETQKEAQRNPLRPT